MQCHSRIKVIAIITGIFFSGILACHANPGMTADMTQGAHDWANNCSRCHNMRAPTEFKPEQWRVITQQMRIQGGLTGQQTRNIYAFLAAQSAGTQTTTVTTQPTSEENMVVASNASSTEKSAVTTKTQSAPTSSLSGKAIYQQTCVACHGANGKGTVPGAANFTDHTGALGKSDAILLQHIKNGYQSPGSPMAMPPKGGNPKLTDDDLKNVLKYIRSTFGH